MTHHEQTAVETSGRPTERLYKRIWRFRLRTFLLAVSAVCVFMWLAPSIYVWLFPMDFDEFFTLPKPTPAASWRGEIPVGDIAEAEHAGRIVADQESWNQLWSVLTPNAPPPRFDFATDFAIVTVGRDRNIVHHHLRLYEGDTLVMCCSLTDGFDESPTVASYTINAIPRKGIKSVKNLDDWKTLARF